MGKNRYFGATEAELDALVAALQAHHAQQMESRRAYYLEHKKYPPRPRITRQYLPLYSVVKVKAEVFSTYHNNHRVLYRKPVIDPNLGLDDLYATTGPMHGIILGVSHRQEGKRFPGYGPSWEDEGESASFDMYRVRPVYTVAAYLFSDPIQALVEDVELVPDTSPDEVVKRMNHLQELLRI